MSEFRETDAAMTRRAANEFLLVGAMDVNEALPRIAVFRIDSLEPEDAGEDQILVTSPFCYHSGLLAASEDHPLRSPGANFLDDPEAARWSSQAPFLTPDAKAGG